VKAALESLLFVAQYPVDVEILARSLHCGGDVEKALKT